MFPRQLTMQFDDYLRVHEESVYDTPDKTEDEEAPRNRKERRKQASKARRARSAQGSRR